MRALISLGLAITALALTTAAHAEEQKCSLIKAATVQMIRSPTDNREILPVTIAGKKENFLLDSGGDLTQISAVAASDLHLPIFADRRTLIGITGTRSSSAARIPEFDIGNLGRANLTFPISPNLGVLGGEWYDGILAFDHLGFYDIDLDFGSDVFNLFSQDHCPGGVVYWQAPAVAVLPIIKSEYNQISITVTLDGHVINANLDTGANTSTLRGDLARELFGLALGSADVPEFDETKADPSFHMYRHAFKSLSFGDIAVANPRVQIIASNNFQNAPQMVIGMDILRKLHVYFALHEGKMYITPATPQTPEQKALQVSLQSATGTKASHKVEIMAQIAALDKVLAAKPNDGPRLNNRCFDKAQIKIDLDSALADCEQALKLEPGDAYALDSRAFVLYQQGKYQDAVAGYDAALAANAKQPESLFMRGHAKGKLGDAAGMQADIAAAKAIKPDIDDEFRVYDVDL